MPPEKTPSTPEIENIPPLEGLPSIYANNIAIGNTVFDVRIIFGEVQNSSATKLTVNQRAQVTMSWLQAKILWEFLGRHINAYEDKNGKLMVPISTGAISVDGLVETRKSAE
jgi:hypothetical protein